MCTFFVMTVLSLILETYEWDTLKDYAKKYENDRDSGTRSLISGINRNYFEPYVMELVFEFTVNANTMIERQIRRMGSIQDDVEKQWPESFTQMAILQHRKLEILHCFIV